MTKFISVDNVLEKFSAPNAEAISTTVLEIFSKEGVPSGKISGLSTDEVAVMVGKHAGVGARLKETNPTLLLIHCICHRLALACNDANSEFKYIATIEDTLTLLWKHFENSAKRLALLLKVQANLHDIEPDVQLTKRGSEKLTKRMKKAYKT